MATKKKKEKQRLKRQAKRKKARAQRVSHQGEVSDFGFKLPEGLLVALLSAVIFDQTIPHEGEMLGQIRKYASKNEVELVGQVIDFFRRGNPWSLPLSTVNRVAPKLINSIEGQMILSVVSYCCNLASAKILERTDANEWPFSHSFGLIGMTHEARLAMALAVVAAQKDKKLQRELSSAVAKDRGFKRCFSSPLLTAMNAIVKLKRPSPRYAAKSFDKLERAIAKEASNPGARLTVFSFLRSYLLEFSKGTDEVWREYPWIRQAVFGEQPWVHSDIVDVNRLDYSDVTKQLESCNGITAEENLKGRLLTFNLAVAQCPCINKVDGEFNHLLTVLEKSSLSNRSCSKLEQLALGKYIRYLEAFPGLDENPSLLLRLVKRWPQNFKLACLYFRISQKVLAESKGARIDFDAHALYDALLHADLGREMKVLFSALVVPLPQEDKVSAITYCMHRCCAEGEYRLGRKALEMVAGLLGTELEGALLQGGISTRACYWLTLIVLAKNPNFKVGSSAARNLIVMHAYYQQLPNVTPLVPPVFSLKLSELTKMFIMGSGIAELGDFMEQSDAEALTDHWETILRRFSALLGQHWYCDEIFGLLETMRRKCLDAESFRQIRELQREARKHQNLNGPQGVAHG